MFLEKKTRLSRWASSHKGLLSRNDHGGRRISKERKEKFSGIRLLEYLPYKIRSDLDSFSRKKNTHLTSMHRDWVFQQLLRMQNEKHPSFSWMQKNVPPCSRFSQGKCSRDDCRYAHITTPPTQNQHANLPAAVDTAADEVTITCQYAIAPDWAGTFTESTSLWSAKKDRLGHPFSVPKSCKPCRDLKKQNYAFSQLNLQPLTLAIEDFGLDIDPDDDTAMADYASRFFE